MFDVVDKTLELALAGGAEGAEVYAERSTSRRIRVYHQQVEELVAARRKGLGLRVFQHGAVGYAYTSDTSAEALDEVVARALAHAKVSDHDEFAVLPEKAAGYPALELFDADLAATDDGAKIELALAVERAALEADTRVKLVEDTSYADGDGEVFLVNSKGVRGSFRANDCYTFAYALAEQNGQIETGLSYAVGRNLAELDAQACGREAALRACALLGSRKVPSMKATVVLDPYSAASVIAVISAALTADAVQRGRSLFASLEGKQVAGERFSLTDNGLHPNGFSSAPFDGEGVPCQRTPLIAAGVLQGFLYDTYTAARGGRRSTGNGLRGSYTGGPAVRPTNLIVGGPATPVADLIGSIERGVLVTNLIGVHSGANPISGEFSVGINGILIESGRLTTPVREVTLAGDIITMLTNVVALGDDARWVPSGSILTPSLVVEGMSISGE
ncbi:MAG: TldD/PmbA family protein [Thermoleophilia bacterium]